MSMVPAVIPEHEHEDYCWSHHRREPSENPYRVCLECNHTYDTPEELLAAYNFDRPPNVLPQTDPGKVFFCPHCIHDF